MSLTSQKLQQMKQTLCKYPIDNPIYIYTIGNKQSSSSLFSNQRILYIDLKLKTINYANIGKQQPFVNGKVPDTKGSINLASNVFKYLRIKQKEPTIKLWEERSVDQTSKKLQEWKFQLYSLDVLLQLINIINFIYNTSRSSQKNNLLKSDVMEVQHPKNNNYLGVDQQPEQGNGPVFTPSSQIIASKVQSPIHKLEDFDDNNQKFKFSDVSANKGGNKDDERMLPSQRFQNDNQERHKANSLPITDKNQIKTSNFTDPANQQRKQINYPPSNQLQSYYDPNATANANKTQKSKSNTIIPPLNMEKLHQTKSLKKYNQAQEDHSFSKLNTEHILNGLSKTENKSPSNFDNGDGFILRSRSKSKHQFKNPMEIQISSIQFRDDKDKGDDDSYNDFRDVNVNDQQGNGDNGNLEGQNLHNPSIGSFGLNNTTYQYKSENYGSRKGGKNKDFNPQEMLDNLKGKNNQVLQKSKQKSRQKSRQKSKHNIEVIIQSQFPDWNRLFFQSNYSIEVYQKFIFTCQNLLKQNILPTRMIKILNSKQPITRINLEGIKFTIYTHTWTQTQPDLHQPTIYLKQHRNNPPSSTLAQLYCRIHNEKQQRRNLWESNRYIMEKLLHDKLQENIRKSRDVLIDRVCANLSFQLEFMGLLVFCQADFDKKCYQLKEKWEVVSQIRKDLSQLQQLINLELPSSAFCLYQRKYKTNLQIQSHIIHITHPIQLISSAKDSLLTSYINRTTLQKNSKIKTVHNTLSAKTLSQFIHRQIEYELLTCINSGYEANKTGRMFHICGSSDYRYMMEYYNVGRDCIGSLYSIIQVQYYQQLIASQLCSDIFSTLLTYTFHQELPILLAQQNFNGYLVTDMEEVYRELLFLWINTLLSYNAPSSQLLWRYLREILNIVYGVKIENPIQGTLPGYTLDFVIDKLGLTLFYESKSNHTGNVGRNNEKNRSRSRSRSKNIEPILRNNYQFPISLNHAYMQADIMNFIKSGGPQRGQQDYKQKILVETSISHYRASKFSLLLKSLENQLLQNLINKKIIDKYTACAIAGRILNFEERMNNKQSIIDIKGIVEQLTVNSNLPPYLGYLSPYLRVYLAQLIGLSDSKKYQHLRIYDPQQLPILSDNNNCTLVPHSSTQLQIYLQILKNHLNPQTNLHQPNPKPNIHDATHLFNSLIQQNVFWGGQYNPYITQAYILFSNYWVTQGDYAQAIKYYKSAMMIYVKLYPDSVFIADRHCYLAELLCALGKYSEAVRELEDGIIKFQKFCVIQGTKEDMKQGRANIETQQQNKLLMLKYIRATIKRSHILLKSTKNTLQQYNRYYTTYSSQQIGQIIDPLYFILNQLKHSNEMSLSDSKKVPLAESASSTYKASKPCLPFIQANILRNQDINKQVVDIFEIVVRCFALNGKFPQLTVFVGQYMLNTNILQPLAVDIECFQKVLMILLYYEIRISSVARKIQDTIIFTRLLENLEQRGRVLHKAEAYSYIYLKYIKNMKNQAADGFNSTQGPLIRNQRQRSRSPGGTNKKTQRPMIILFLKRITESLKKIQKIWNEIEKFNLIETHIPLSHGTRTEAEELIVLLQAIAALVGYQYLLALVQSEGEQYYQCTQVSQKNSQRDQSDKNNIRIEQEVAKNLRFAIRKN